MRSRSSAHFSTAPDSWPLCCYFEVLPTIAMLVGLAAANITRGCRAGGATAACGGDCPRAGAATLG